MYKSVDKIFLKLSIIYRPGSHQSNDVLRELEIIIKKYLKIILFIVSDMNVDLFDCSFNVIKDYNDLIIFKSFTIVNKVDRLNATRITFPY